MTYTIVNTAGTTVATVNEAQVNSNFDVTLIGKNYTNYGQIFNDNMYRLLENFASSNPSGLKPVKGQIWFNTSNNTLNLYDGTAWNSFGGVALTVKGTKVGINNKNPDFDLDVTSTFRTKGAAWINYQGANNSDANQNGLVLGTVGKGTTPTNNAGTIGIWSSETATDRLQAMLSLKTDPTVTNRRLSIGVIEQGTGWRNITLAETGGNVGIGTNTPATKLEVRGISRVSDGTVNSDQSVDGTNAYAGTTSNHAYAIKTNATNRLFITSDGNVGIATDTPTGALEVAGNIVSSGSNAGINFKNNTGTAYVNYDDVLTVARNGAMASSLTIDAAGNVGINQDMPENSLDIQTLDQSTQGVRLLSTVGTWVQTFASLPAGQYNPAVQAGDSAIIYSAGTIDTGRLVIAPWGTAKSGIVLDSTGKFGTNTLSTVQFTGTARGAFAVNDINSTLNQWTSIDFSNPANNEIPLARIAMEYTTGGTYLSLGTSNRLVSGITNQAVTIDPNSNVGIGTVSPAKLLDVVGDAALRGNTYIGTNIIQSISADDSTLYLRGSNVAIQNDSATATNVYITANGDVGIGTVTPVTKLEVTGNIRSTVTGNNSLITVNSVGGSGRTYSIASNTNGTFSLYDHAASAQRIIVTSAGVVGIGVVTPDTSAMLDVASTVQATTPGPIATSSHGAFRIKADATDSQGVLQFVNHAGDAQKGFIRVDNTGNMILHVDGLTSDSLIISSAGVYTDGVTGLNKGQGTINAKGLFVNGVAVSAGIGAGYTPSYPVGAGENWAYTDPGGQSTYYWGTSDGHAMRSYSTASLSVAYAASAGNAVNATNAVEATRASTAASAQSVNASNNYQMNSLGVGTAPSGTTGMIRATNDIIAFYSDGRLKDNVELIVNPLDKVLSLRGVTHTQNKLAEQFGYNNYESRVGVIAQDVAAVLPEAVALAPFDTDAEGASISGENYLTVKYEKLVP